MGKAMETIEKIRLKEGLKKSDLAPTEGERSKYYKNLEADDIKVGVFKEYLKRMGYKLFIAKDGIDI